MKNNFLYIFMFFTTVSSEIKNDFILDYFNYKKTSGLVGFTCNSFEDNASLMKNFNEMNMFAVLKELTVADRIHRFAYTDRQKIGIFIDSQCYDLDLILSLLSEAADYRMYNELHIWLIIVSNSVNVSDIISDNDEAFGVSTDFVIAVPFIEEMEPGFELYDVWNIWKERGTTCNIILMGSWQKETRLSITLDPIKSKRRTDLEGVTMNAGFSYVAFKPDDKSLEEYLQDFLNTTTDGLSKFGYVMVSHLSDLFNFKVNCLLGPSWITGDPHGPLINGLYNKTWDITGSPATINKNRTYLVKYAHYTWPFRSCFIFRSIQPKSIKINEVFGPLAKSVWYFTFILFTISVIFMIIALYCEADEKVLMLCSNSFLIIIGSLCQQGTDLRIQHMSTRIAFLFIVIFSYIIYNYYSASVVSIRLNEPIYKLNDSLVELGKTDFKLASEWMVYFTLFIKRDDWETMTFYNTRVKKIPESEMFMEPEKAIKLVQQRKLAYHMHPDVGYPIIDRLFSNREICELTEVHLIRPTFMTVAVNYNSSFAELIRVGMAKIVDVGIRHREVRRWKSPKPICSKTILSSSAVNLFEFAPHLFLLIGGMVVSVVILALEIIIKKRNLDYKNRPNI